MQEAGTCSGNMVMGREVPPLGKAEPTEWGRGSGSFWHQEGLPVGHRWRKLWLLSGDQLVPVSIKAGWGCQEAQAQVRGRKRRASPIWQNACSLQFCSVL